ncbi:MAG TPA: hypothetical protein PK040_09040 [Anaerolineaceae bacterium]|nr:hypothetical protein [Anaerolineaceae bacterium]
MNRANWENWTSFLQKPGIAGISEFLLEGGGPLRYLAAQVLLASTPFWKPDSRILLTSFAEMMEDPQESTDFLVFLRQGEAQREQ